MLQRREADICIASMSFRHDRAQVNDVSFPITGDAYVLFVKSKGSYELNTFEMLNVFGVGVWVALALTCLVTFVGFLGIFMLEKLSSKDSVSSDKSAILFFILPVFVLGYQCNSNCDKVTGPKGFTENAMDASRKDFAHCCSD